MLPFPSFQPNQQDATEVKIRKGDSPRGNAKLANPIMVPHGSRNDDNETNNLKTFTGQTHYSRKASSTVRKNETDYICIIRKAFIGTGLSVSATNLVISSWRKSTLDKYRPFIILWLDY